jgi:hypothetical protein
MNLTNHFRVAHGDVRIAPEGILAAAPTLKNGVLEGALTAAELGLDAADLPAEVAEIDTEAAHAHVDLFALDGRPPESGEKRLRRIAGLETMGGNGLWGERGRKAEDERKQSEARSVESRRMMMNLQIQQQIAQTREIVTDFKRNAHDAVTISEENVRLTDEDVEEKKKNALKLSSGEEGFLSKDGTYFETVDGEVLTDPKLIAEAKEKKKKNPQSADAEDFDQSLKRQKKAHEGHEEGKNLEREAEQADKKRQDIEDHIKNAKTDEEKQKWADKLKELGEQTKDRNEHAKEVADNARHLNEEVKSKTYNEVSKAREYNLSTLTNGSVQKRTEDIKNETGMSEDDLAMLMSDSVPKKAPQKIKEAESNRALGSFAKSIDPAESVSKTPDLTNTFAAKADPTTSPEQQPIPTISTAEPPIAKTQQSTSQLTA